MVHNNVVLTVKQATEVDDIRHALIELAEASRDEPGCVRFEVHHSTTDPRVFLLIETWQNEAALAQHREADAFSQIYRPNVLPRVDREPHQCEQISA